MPAMRSFLFTAALLAPGLAFADIAPEPGYVETCTVEKQCKKTEDGDECRAWHGDREVCRKKHQSDGFVYKCNSRGASVWSEVYCRPKGDKAKSDKPPAKS